MLGNSLKAVIPSLGTARAAAGIPKLINFQGRLTDGSDNLLSGTYYLCFSIHDAASAGSKVWPAGNPTPTAVTVSNGVFSAQIGSADALDADFNDDSYYLEVDVDADNDSDCTAGGEVLYPRQRVTSAGYAFNADTVDGIHAAATATVNKLLALDASGDLVLGAGDVSATNAVLSGDLTVQGGNIAVGSTLDTNIGINDTTNNSTAQYRFSGDNSAVFDIYGSADADSDLSFLSSRAGRAVTIDLDGQLEVNGSGNSWFAGNLGIGTTNPAQKLHVEGQCVVGDTELYTTSAPEVQGSKFEVRGKTKIKDLKPGDSVYGLDEETGEVKAFKVQALLDMGVKPIFKLTTKDGKVIETTGNHPYLSVKRSNENDETVATRKITSLAAEYGIDPESIQADRDVSQGRAIWVDRSIQESSSLNSQLDSRGQGDVVSESICGVSLQSKGQSVRNSNLSDSSRESELHNQAGQSGSNGSSLHSTEEVIKTDQLYQESQWRKVICLSPGDLVAVSSFEPSTSNLEPYVVWSEIISIEYVGKEQVYDVAVEGNRNFFGNGILAHNTYLSGNVGIGTTAPSAKLEINSAAWDVAKFFTTHNTAEIFIGDSMDGNKTLVVGYKEDDNYGFLAIYGDSAGHGLNIADGGDVGIGIVKPEADLDVIGATQNDPVTLGSEVPGLILQQRHSAAPPGPYYGPMLEFRMYNGTSTWTNGAIIGLDNSGHSGELAFLTQPGGENDPTGRRTKGAALVERMRIDKNGNVGIGTTNPVQKLHVAGNCITGDSLLYTAPADSTAGQEFTGHSSQFTEIQIKDIKPGTFVYSRNEETGKIETQKINKLLDMGIKPVFRLKTENGKEIRTTGNHPYLVQLTNDELNSRIQLRETGSLEEEHGLGQGSLSSDYEFSETREIWSSRSTEESGNIDTAQYSRGEREVRQQRVYPVSLSSSGQSLRSSSLSQIGSGTQLLNGTGRQETSFSSTRDQQNDIRSDNLPQEKSWLNQLDRGSEFGDHGRGDNELPKKGDVDQKPNDQHQGKSDLDFNVNINEIEPFLTHIFPHLLSSNAITKANVANTKLLVNSQRLSRLGSLEVAGTINAAPNQPAAKFTNKSETTENQTGSGFIENNLTKEKSGVNVVNNIWAKVIYLQKGDLIATVSFPSSCEQSTVNCEPYVVWDRIKSIEYVGYEQVYDIEVEGTHNFVGNGILAHNTYISGNVGIGVTDPDTKLEIFNAGTQLKLSFDATDFATFAVDTNHDLTIKPSSTGQIILQPTTDSTDFFQVLDADGGIPILNIDATNERVGIGTTNPGAKLHLYSTASYPALTVESTTSDGGVLQLKSTDNYYNLYMQGDDLRFYQGVDRVTLTNDGNVGIGTTAPGNDLEVIGGINAEDIRLTKSLPYVWLDDSTVDEADWFLMTNASLFSINKDGTGMSTATLVIDTNGNVGIGTTGPAAQLDIVGSNLYISEGSSETATDTFVIRHYPIYESTPGRTTTSAIAFLKTSTANDTYDGEIQFRTRTTGAGMIDAMRIDKGGNVGIGTTGPNAKLDLGPTTGKKLLTYWATNIYQGLGVDIEGGPYESDWFGSAGTSNQGFSTIGFYSHAEPPVYSEKVRIQAGGNVGIGTTNPGAQLDLSTDNARKLTTTTWATGSDARIKTNVQSIDDALEIIREIRPVKFHYTQDFLSANPSVNDTDYYHFIAQEYQGVFPNSVTETDGLLYLNSSNMIPYAIAGIKALDQETKEQQEQISLISGQLGEMNLTESGELEIITRMGRIDTDETDGETSSEVAGLPAIERIASKLATSKSVSLVNSAGETIERIIVGAEGVFAKVRAGLIEVADLSAINIIASKLAISEKIISPVVEAEEVRTRKLATDIISPLADGGEVEIQSAKFKVQSYSSKFKVVDPEDKEVASIDAFGRLKARVAEITERIKTKTLEVEELFINGEEITRIERIDTDDGENSSGVAGLPAIERIASKLATSEGEENSGGEDLLTIPDNPDNEQLPLVLASDWTVLGTTSLAQTSVAGIFSQDGSLVIDKGSEIDNIVGTLYLQRLGRGGLDILNGKVVLDTKGNLTVDGDIVATGKLEVADLSAINIIASKLATSEKIISPLVETNIISPLADGGEVEIQSAKFKVQSYSSKFKVVDPEDREIASIDSRGVARFAKLAFAEETGSSEVAGLPAIEGIASKLATSNSVSNSSVGTAILPSGDHSVEIETTAVTEDSLIFVTPTSPTGGSTLYVSEKQAGESFTVSLEKEYEERDVEFNWWVIN